MASSIEPSASSDGRYVAFSSRRQPPGGRGDSPMVFVRDTALQSHQAGRRWMESFAERRWTLRRIRRTLTPGAAHLCRRPAHRRDAASSRRACVEASRTATSARPVMSSDGRFVVFQSEASDLVAVEDFNLLWDVFVLDRTTNAMTRLSGDARRGVDGAEQRAVDRRDAVRSSPSRRAIRPTRRTSATTSISTSPRFRQAQWRQQPHKRSEDQKGFPS